MSYLLLAALAIQSPAPSIALAPCTIPDVTGRVLCGTHSVFENRATRTGRRIALNIVVLPATGTGPAAEPLFVLEGGPGSAATEDAEWMAGDPFGLRARHDIVLVDQRGTGGSNPLVCSFYGPPDSLQAWLGDFLPAPALRRCRDSLAATADLTQYTTAAAMDDLDEVRRGLGYRRINLVGYSYGTRAVLQYLRTYAANARTAALYGVIPPGTYVPGHFARDTENSLRGVQRDCMEDTDCRLAYPNLVPETNRVLATLTQHPVTTTVTHPKTGAAVQVTLTRNMFAETLRYLLYRPSASARIPAVIHAAAGGDYRWIARQALRDRGGLIGTGTFDGLYVAITCAEDLPFVDERAAVDEARGTFLGAYRVTEQKRACTIWPRGKIPADFHQPVGVAVPTLIFSGAFDPVTPAAQGTATARALPNAVQIIVPHGHHSSQASGLEGTECLTRLFREFVEAGTARGLATGCVQQIRRKGFATSLELDP